MNSRALFKTGILLALPLLATGQTSSITCSLATDKTSYKIGETPQFIIRIQNNGDSTVQFVKVLDGSDVQWRYPYSYYEVGRLGHQPPKTAATIIRCGNMDGISTDDFVTVAPGQSFSPYGNQSAVYTSSSVPGVGQFRKKGRYRVVYYYATDEPDFRKWMGDMASSWFDWETGQVNPSNQEQYQQLLTLFSKVPKVRLASNEVLFTFE